MPRRLAVVAPYVVEVLEYEEAPLQPHQVRVKSELASAKHGTNMGTFEGTNFEGTHFDPEWHIFKPTLPASDDQPAPKPGPRGLYGAMAVGVVTEVGAGVTRWKVGDRVFGDMDVRETNACDASRLWELGTIDPELALCLEPAYVAFHSVRESNIRFGDSVAVVGLGAIGLLAVRMARQGGAENVFAIDPLPGRRECALKLGADYALDPRTCDVGMTVHELTGTQGVDVTIEVAGKYQALQDAIRCTRVGGTVCMTGFYQGTATSVWFGREAHHNRLNFLIPHGCGWANLPRDYPRWDHDRANNAMVGLMRKGILSAPGLLYPIVSIEEGPQVWRWIAEDPNKVIKFAVRF